MTLKIISAEEILFEGDVKIVHLPGGEGDFTVLQNHASLISTLTKGVIRYIPSDEEHEHATEISGGIADVDNNIVSVCIY